MDGFSQTVLMMTITTILNKQSRGKKTSEGKKEWKEATTVALENRATVAKNFRYTVGVI